MFEDIIQRPIIREFLEEYSIEHWKEVIENVMVCGISHLRSKHPFSLTVNQLEVLTKISKSTYTPTNKPRKERKTPVSRARTPLKIADHIPEPRICTLEKARRQSSISTIPNKGQINILKLAEDIFAGPYMSMFMSGRRDKTISNIK